MFAGSMPNFRTSAVAVETATKCLATARSSASARTHQARAVRAFVSVSIGVNVLAVHDDARAARRPQRHVQHRALLGDVDLLAREHRVPSRGHAGGSR